MKRVLSILIFFIFSLGLKAQKADTSNYLIGIIQGNDTIYHKQIEQINVYPNRKFDNKRQQRRYSRLVAKVKKVYPLAVEARELLKEYEPKYYALDNKHDRRKLMKNLEKELFSKHKEENSL